MNDEQLHEVVLSRGCHATFEQGCCVMELAAAYVGAPHSARPACVSDAIGTLLRPWNDALDDVTRQLLRGYVPRLVRTAGDSVAEALRPLEAADWVIRVAAPVWLDAARHPGHAAALRALPALERASVAQIGEAVQAAYASRYSAHCEAAEGARERSETGEWYLARGDGRVAVLASGTLAAFRASVPASRDDWWWGAAVSNAATVARLCGEWLACGGYSLPLALTRDHVIRESFSLLDRMIDVGGAS